MVYTPNLHLKKPEDTDFYDVADFNDNMDTLDGIVSDASETAKTLEEMIMSNYFEASILTDDGEAITDDDGNEILANWSFKVA